MEQKLFPFECKCSVKLRKAGLFELNIKGLPHPTDPEGTHSMMTTGRTLGEAFFNMGHHLTLSFEELAPGLLDWAVCDEPRPELIEKLRFPNWLQF